MTTVDTETPDEQVGEPILEVDAGDPTPPSTEAPAPPSAAEEPDTIKELRDRLSQSGRVIAELRNQNGTLAGQIATTNQRLEALGAQLSQDEQRRQQAYLSSLPPEQREREELRLNNHRLETRLSALEREKTAPRQPTEQEQQQATIQLAQQMAAEASGSFGLDADEQVQWNDPRLQAAGAWESPEAYRRQVAILARKIANGKESPRVEQGAAAVAENKNKAKAPAAAPAAPSETEIQKRIDEGIAKALGTIGGAPNSPRPAAMVPERTPDEQAYQNTLRGYSSQQGPRATRAALKEQLAKAEVAVSKAAR